MQASSGEKVVRGFGRFGGGGGRERIEELGDLGFVGIADDPGDAGKCGQFLGSALGIASGDDDSKGGVGGVKFSNGVAGLGVGGGGDGAGVDDDDICGGLRGATTELFDKEAGHLEAPN
ncbi:MAG: hypothetical protein AUH66_03100 [Acidobacteria bacterium 13_1_40CM_4_57_6]|nr:MAG: hypothetical protein AUH66_03100 [Acidobacteria bacterium 13_1_40CM_4_57_6]